MYLGQPRVGAQHLAQPVHHGRDAPLHRDRHDKRAALVRRQVRRGHLRCDQLGRFLPPVQPPLDDQDRVLGQQQRALLVGGREEQHLDGAFQVLQGGGGPRVALPGDLPLHPGQDPADGDQLAVGPATPLLAFGIVGGGAEQLGHGTIRVRGHDVLHAEQWVVRDVQAEHLPLEGQQGGLVPLAVRHRDLEAGLGLRVPAEQRVLADGLVPLDVDDGVDGLLVDDDQALARVLERVERARLDQRFDDPLVAHVHRDLAQEVSEAAERPLAGPGRPRWRPRRWCRRCGSRPGRTGCRCPPG